jgi:hypothetical protein
MSSSSRRWTASGSAATAQLQHAQARAYEFVKLSSDFYGASLEIPAIKQRFPEPDDLQVRMTSEPQEGKMPHDRYRCYSIQGLTGLLINLMNGLTIDAHAEPADAFGTMTTGLATRPRR